MARTLLRDKRTRVNSRDRQRRTALHLAAHHGRPGVVSLLLRSERTDVCSRDWRERTALTSVVEGCRAAATRTAHTRSTRTAHARSTRTVHTRSYEEFNKAFFMLWRNNSLRQELRMSELNNLLLEAARAGNVCMFKFLMRQRGISVCSPSRHTGITPLMAATIAGSVEIVSVLLKHKSIKRSHINACGRSISLGALYEACKLGHDDVVRILLEDGRIGRYTAYRALYGSTCPESMKQMLRKYLSLGEAGYAR